MMESDFLLQSEEAGPLNKVIDMPFENAELNGLMKTVERSEVETADKTTIHIKMARYLTRS